MKNISSLISLSKKNLSVCPWCSVKPSLEYFKFLKDEIVELEEALKKDDLDNIEEELGDVLWVTLTLILICEREKKVQSEMLVDRILKKFIGRKPWLLTNEKVTSDEAVKIWNEAKKKEKEAKLSKNK